MSLFWCPMRRTFKSLQRIGINEMKKFFIFRFSSLLILGACLSQACEKEVRLESANSLRTSFPSSQLIEVLHMKLKKLQPVDQEQLHSFKFFDENSLPQSTIYKTIQFLNSSKTKSYRVCFPLSAYKEFCEIISTENLSRFHEITRDLLYVDHLDLCLGEKVRRNYLVFTNSHSPFAFYFQADLLDAV
jgi:hypothetical protein